MGTKYKVIGQTGSTALSVEKLMYKLAHKRTLQYWVRKLKIGGFKAEIIGPFHSRLYGACSYGTSRAVAKERLQDYLANEYGYLGRLSVSKTDDAERVRYPTETTSDRPITKAEFTGSAGQ